MKKKLWFPIVMTAVSFICFIYVYWYVTYTAVVPYYVSGLIFIIPTLCFSAIYFFACRNKLSASAANVWTGILTAVLSVVFLGIFIFFALDAATIQVTDSGMYNRVMTKTNSDHRENLKHFPEFIPENAKDVQFFYCPQFLQGSEEYTLSYSVSREEIDNIISECEFKWIGTKDSEGAEKYPLFSYDDEWISYIIDCSEGDFNHGYNYGFKVNEDKSRLQYYSEIW